MIKKITNDETVTKYAKEKKGDIDDLGEYPHRTIYRRYYGQIPSGYHVHHINGNHHDNDPKNLIALPEVIHNYIHSTKDKKYLPNRGDLGFIRMGWDLAIRHFSFDEKEKRRQQRKNRKFKKRLKRQPWRKIFEESKTAGLDYYKLPWNL